MGGKEGEGMEMGMGMGMGREGKGREGKRREGKGKGHGNGRGLGRGGGARERRGSERRPNSRNARRPSEQPVLTALDLLSFAERGGLGVAVLEHSQEHLHAGLACLNVCVVSLRQPQHHPQQHIKVQWPLSISLLLTSFSASKATAAAAGDCTLRSPASRSRMGVMDSCSHTVGMEPSTASSGMEGVEGTAASPADKVLTEAIMDSLSFLQTTGDLSVIHTYLSAAEGVMMLCKPIVHSHLVYSPTVLLVLKASSSSCSTSFREAASLTSFSEKKQMPRMLMTALLTVVERCCLDSGGDIVAERLLRHRAEPLSGSSGNSCLNPPLS